MSRFACFLRAVNLGPTNKVSSVQLKEEFATAGFDDVGTFRTSGNVVFDSNARSTAKLEEKITKHLGKALGFEVPVFVRSAAEITAIAEGEPFDAKAIAASKGKPQVIFLAGKPTAAVQKKILALATGKDLLAFGERELYWLPSGGTLDSPLDLKAIAKLLDGLTTMRTKGTVDLVAQKFFA